jgi:hypothetical protein
VTVQTVDPADALQVGVYQLLTGADIGADVYDNVPEDASAPYVEIGEMVATEDSAHGNPGRQTVCVLHTWTRARSHRPGNQIGAAVVEALARQEATLDPLVDGHIVWQVEHEFSQTLKDPEPGVRHRVDRFRIRTRQEVSP